MYKDYTIKFYSDRWDYYNNGTKNHYYLLSVASPDERTNATKFIKCNTPQDLATIKNFINSDRQLTIFYILHNDNKYIDDMQTDLQQIIINFYKGLTVGGLKK